MGFKQRDGGTMKCEGCGSVYHVTLVQTPIRDADDAHCEVCGVLLDEWKSTTFPIFELIEPVEPTG